MKSRIAVALALAVPLGLATFGLVRSAFAADVSGQWTAALDSVKDIMKGPLTDSSDVVFDAVETDVDASGTHKRVPQTEQEWANIKKNAQIVMESGNLIVLPGRDRKEQQWTAQTKAMITAASDAVKAAEAKDPDAIFAAGQRVNRSCDTCHRFYPEEQDKPAPGAAITDVGTPHYTFTFQVTGQKLTGKVKSDDAESVIQNGTVNGDQISFVESVQVLGEAIPVAYSGKITGNQIKFTRKIGTLASESFNAERHK